MRNLAVTAPLAVAVAFAAAPSFFPLKDIRAGMHGYGRTVFSGNRIDEFQVEILGVLENVGPKQSLILAKLSGGPLEQTGVLQGMSGSPVFVGGRLIGAVALAFPFSKAPIAGIRPIEDMLRVGENRSAQPVRLASLERPPSDLAALFPRPEDTFAGDARMIDIATPISFGGFTRGTIDRFAPQLRSLGLEPRQGVSFGGRMDPRMGDPADLKPGSMISVQLMTGDMSIGADGTVTWIDGDKVYAFGHRFLEVGPTALPFARSEVMTLLPNLSASFKISAPKELMGTIYQDRNTAVAGELGKRPEMVPVSVSLASSGRKTDRYDMQMVNDRFLSPFLVQMAVFSIIDSTERTIGASSFVVKGQIELQGVDQPVKLDNMYAGDAGTAAQVSLSTAVPLAYVMQSGFSALQVRRVALDIASFNEKKQLQIDDVIASRREVHPGENLELTAILQGENGAEVVRKVNYQVPRGAPPGTLFFTVADGNTTNLAEFRQIIGNPPRSADQLVSTVNRLRANTRAYVRVWRADPAFQLEGEDFPAPPPSLALVLAGSQGVTQTRNSKITELEINAGDAVISGSKTIQVEVKE